MSTVHVALRGLYPQLWCHSHHKEDKSSGFIVFKVICDFSGEGSECIQSGQTCDGVQSSDQQKHDDSKIDVNPNSLVDKNGAREHVCLNGLEKRKHIISVYNMPFWYSVEKGEGNTESYSVVLM